MIARQNSAWAGPLGLAHAVIQAWALVGGLFLIALVVMNTGSVISAALIGKPFPGDYELTEQFVAVAAFSFLAYCQIQDANVTADIFTSGASPRFIAFMKLLTAVIALIFGTILVYEMSRGLVDTRKYGYQTAVLGLPIWYTYIPIVISLVMLVLAAITSLIESVLAAISPAEAGEDA